VAGDEVNRDEPRVMLAVGDGALEAKLGALLAAHPVAAAERGPGVLDLLDRHSSLRLLILFEAAPDDGALDLLQAARQRRGDLAVIVLSAHPTIEHATEAIRRGAEDFVAVPFSEELLRKEVERVLEAAELRDRVEDLRHQVFDCCGLERIVSRSPRMRPVFERARAAALSDTPVLVTGETGTGKELVARAIHSGGRRATKAFVAVNCAALPRELVESELFGHRRGAFSGADRDFPGLFAGAHGGTLFLDEIGDLSLEAQAKLLRALQDGEIRPVGGLESRRVDVRIIAATNRGLSELRGGRLRPDLFFRLSVLVIELPPLRERYDDIPHLVAHFLVQLRARGVASVEGIDADALELVAGYPFPGNVRELENLLEALSVTLPSGRRSIRADDVRAWLRRRNVGPASTPVHPHLRLDELEAWAIEEALRLSHGNKSQAAHRLGISRDTLYRKLQDRTLPLSESRTETSRS
jgi:DNA-binding NtrC family response regulator